MLEVALWLLQLAVGIVLVLVEALILRLMWGWFVVTQFQWAHPLTTKQSLAVVLVAGFVFQGGRAASPPPPQVPPAHSGVVWGDIIIPHPDPAPAPLDAQWRSLMESAWHILIQAILVLIWWLFF